MIRLTFGLWLVMLRLLIMVAVGVFALLNRQLESSYGNPLQILPVTGVVFSFMAAVMLINRRAVGMSLAVLVFSGDLLTTLFLPKGSSALTADMSLGIILVDSLGLGLSPDYGAAARGGGPLDLNL